MEVDFAELEVPAVVLGTVDEGAPAVVDEWTPRDGIPSEPALWR